jgi:hypothetical protein
LIAGFEVQIDTVNQWEGGQVASTDIKEILIVKLLVSLQEGLANTRVAIFHKTFYSNVFNDIDVRLCIGISFRYFPSHNITIITWRIQRMGNFMCNQHLVDDHRQFLPHWKEQCTLFHVKSSGSD